MGFWCAAVFSEATNVIYFLLRECLPLNLSKCLDARVNKTNIQSLQIKVPEEVAEEVASSRTRGSWEKCLLVTIHTPYSRVHGTKAQRQDDCQGSTTF